MPDYDSYRVLAGRIRMHVMDWPGEEPPVLFLHGYTANGLAALPLANLLAKRNRLIAPDLRGRGLSDMPFGEYGIQTHLKDVIGCLNKLGIERVIAAGHSFGATINIFLAANYPERVGGLILFDGGAIPGESAARFLDAYYDNLQYRYNSADEYVDRYRHAPLYQPFTPELEILVRSNLYLEPDGTYIRRVPRFVVEADKRADHWEALMQLSQFYRKVKCPVLIIRAENGIIGAEDQVLPDEVVESMCAGIPQAQVITVQGAGHTSLLTIPDASRDDAVLEFLAQFN
jgi:pimeloyl-ACP methyl ester carboxylesterase